MTSQDPVPKPLRVLLIEDNDSDALLLQRMLKQAKPCYDVTRQVSLTSALMECGEAPWDLVLTDLFLPDSQGLDTFLQCQRAWPDVPLVVLSGDADEVTAQLAVDAGAQDYLVKGDINARVLCRVLKYSASRHRAAAERRFLVKELEHSRRLEAIGQLAAGVAHEINTPTQYVSDNTRFLRDAFAEVVTLLRGLQNCVAEDHPPTTAELRELLATADVEYLLDELPRSVDQSLNGLGHIARIVRAMKEFSHPSSDEKTPTDLNKALQTTVLVASNEWKYVAEVETDFASDLPLVECLAGEMNQVFLNLLVNAAHAVADNAGLEPNSKGRITISTRAVGNDAVEVRIQDTGCGIRPEHRAKIFEQFFTTKEVGKGTGQGLAIARNVVVNKHGGTIDFESEVGQGTTFIVRLPRSAPLASQSSQAA
jgi:signal transduction histidine kinase